MIVKVPCVERGCGVRRKAGGVYAVSSFSPYGLPLEHFLYCSPRPLPEWLVLPKLGQVFVPSERNGIPIGLIFDWIGEMHYPNVADFLEEGRCYGFSRLLSPVVARQAARMRENWLLPVHARGLVVNWMTCRPRVYECPRPRNPHPLPDGDEERRYGEMLIAELGREAAGWNMCSGFWWEVIEGGECDMREGAVDGAVVRRIGAVRYYGREQLPGWRGEFAPAVLGRIPLNRLEVVVGGEWLERMEELKGAEFPVVAVEEIDEQ